MLSSSNITNPENASSIALTSLLDVGVAKDKAEKIISLSTVEQISHLPKIVEDCVERIISFGKEDIHRHLAINEIVFIYTNIQADQASSNTNGINTNLQDMYTSIITMLQNVIPVNEFMAGLINKKAVKELEKFITEEAITNAEDSFAGIIARYGRLPVNATESILDTNLEKILEQKRRFIHSRLFLNGNFTNTTLVSSISSYEGAKTVCIPTPVTAQENVVRPVALPNNMNNLRIYNWQLSLPFCLLIGITIGAGLRGVGNNIYSLFKKNDAPVKTAAEELDLRNLRTTKNV